MVGHGKLGRIKEPDPQCHNMRGWKCAISALTVVRVLVLSTLGLQAALVSVSLMYPFLWSGGYSLLPSPRENYRDVYKQAQSLVSNE